MMQEERLKAIQEMDAVIERAERACQTYELIHMENAGTGKGPTQTADSEEGGTREGVK